MKKTDAAPSQTKSAIAPAVNNAVKNLPVKELRTLEGHTASVVAVKFSSNGNYCVSGSYDRTLRLWNPQKGTTIKLYKGHGYQVVDLVISNDNTQIASCGGDRAPFLWDVSSGNIIRRFKGHDQRLNTIAWNSDNSVLVTGSYDKTVKLWDCKSRSFDPIQTLEEAKDSVSSVYITSQEIITGSIDGRVRVYDIRKGELRSDYIGQPVTSVSLSHDENILLVSTLDSTIRLLDKEDGTLYHEYKDHKNKEFKIDSIFTMDDAHVVSGSEDGNIYFWSLEDGEVVYVSRAHKQMTTGLCYHPTECFMLSASADHTIKYWGSPAYELSVA